MNRFRKSPAVKGLCCVLCMLMLGGGSPVVWAQVVQPISLLEGDSEKLITLSFRDAPVDVVLDHYAEITGRTMIRSPGIPQVLISLRGQQRLTETEFLQAIEAVLQMNNISLIPLGEKFLKVVPSGELGTHGGEIRRDPATGDPLLDPGSDTMDTRIFEFQHIDYTEIQPILESFKRPFGRIQPLERTNSLLITDTAATLQKMAEIIGYLDVPLERRVETRVYELNHAEAAQVAARLNELVQDSTQDPRRAGAQAAPVRTVRGVIRPGQIQQPQPPGTPAPEAEVAEAVGQGIILPPVKLVSDDRTNILIVITRPENFAFFDNIVTILDRSIEPNFLLEVIPLEFADAGEIAGILNDFVGAATADAQTGRTGARAAAAAPGAATDPAARATALQDLVRQRLAERDAAARAAARATQADGLTDEIGRLSANTRILSDQRTNSILLMGRRQDIEALRRVVESLDIMLAQVLIEAVILEVNLNEGLEYGIDWLQRSFTVSNVEQVGPGGGMTVRDPVFAFGGAQNLRGSRFVDGSQVSRENAPDLFSAGSLSYYLTFFDLNLDAVVRLAAGTSDARILSTPVVVTTDNTEARILVGESRPVVTSTSTTAGGVARNTFQYQEIGISLNVTPRINPQNFVVMEITQTADNVGGFEVIDGNNVPIITRRELQAQIAVEDRGTIVLGGLVSSDGQNSTVKVPILGDIPLLGSLFRSVRQQKNRTELLVLITPYVLSTPQDVTREARRLRDRSFVDSSTWEGTWSDSKLLRPESLRDESEAKPPLLDMVMAKPTDAPGIFERSEWREEEIPVRSPEPGEVPMPVDLVDPVVIELDEPAQPKLAPVPDPVPPPATLRPEPDDEEVWRPVPSRRPVAPPVEVPTPELPSPEPVPVPAPEPATPPDPVEEPPPAVTPPPARPVPVVPTWSPDDPEEDAAPPLAGEVEPLPDLQASVEPEASVEPAASLEPEPSTPREPGFFSRIFGGGRSAEPTPLAEVEVVQAPPEPASPAVAAADLFAPVPRRAAAPAVEAEEVVVLPAAATVAGEPAVSEPALAEPRVISPEERVDVAMARRPSERQQQPARPATADTGWQRAPTETGAAPSPAVEASIVSEAVRAAAPTPVEAQPAAPVVTAPREPDPSATVPRRPRAAPVPTDGSLPVRRTIREVTPRAQPEAQPEPQPAPEPAPALAVPVPADPPAVAEVVAPAEIPQADVETPQQPVEVETPEPLVEAPQRAPAPMPLPRAPEPVVERPALPAPAPAEVPTTARPTVRPRRAAPPAPAEEATAVEVSAPAETEPAAPVRGLEEELRAVISDAEAEQLRRREAPGIPEPEGAEPPTPSADLLQQLPQAPPPVRMVAPVPVPNGDDLEAPPPLQ